MLCDPPLAVPADLAVRLLHHWETGMNGKESSPEAPPPPASPPPPWGGATEPMAPDSWQPRLDRFRSSRSRQAFPEHLPCARSCAGH